MSGDGTTYEIDIPVNGAGIEPAAVAMARLAQRMSEQTAAAASAAAAAKAGSAAYDEAEKTANRAATALEKLTAQTDAQRAKVQAAVADQGIFSSAAQKASDKLAALTQRQSEAAAKAQSTASAMSSAAASADALAAAATAAATKEASLAASVQKANAAAADQAKAAKAAADEEVKAGKAAADAAAKHAKSTADAAQKTAAAQDLATNGSGKANEAAEAFGKLGGPLGALGQKAFGSADALKKMSGSLGSLGPYAAAAIAVVAIATAAVTLTIALVSATVAIGSWAVSLGDAARTQGLLLQGIGRSAQGGRELATTIERLGNQVPLTNDELQSMASSLADSGLRGQALSNALETAAEKAARLKFGPDFKRQMLSLDFQSQKLKRGIAGIFGGLEIEGVLDAFSKLVALFDKNTETGKAIKVVFESLFQPLLDGVTAFVPKMVSAFIQFEILVLKAMLAVKPFGSQILLVAKAFGVLALIVAAMTVGFVVAVITPFAIIIGLAVALIVWIFKLVDGFVELLGSASAFGSGLMASVGAAFDWLAGLSLTGIGGALIDGLIAGITGAGGGVLTAITGVANGAIDAAKKTLGIASPSKVFAEIGGYTAKGMEQGVDAGASDVQASMQSLADPGPTAAAAGGAAPAAPAKSDGGGAGAPIVMNFYGVPGAEDAKEMLINAAQDVLALMGRSPSAART